jgi:hypothetical protein
MFRMRKIVAATVAGLMLVAGQAVAAGSTESARIGDRIGATTEASEEFAGIPLPVLLIGAAVLVAAVVVVSDDDSESD